MSTLALLKFATMLSRIWDEGSTPGHISQSLALSSACLPSGHTSDFPAGTQSPDNAEVLIFSKTCIQLCVVVHSISLTWNDYLFSCIKIVHILQSTGTNIF